MFKKMMAYGLLLVVGYQAQAQGPVLRGLVQDSISKQVLEEATASLLHKNRLLRQLRSSKSGFIFRGLPSGDYQLVTTYLGYATDTMTVQLDRTDKKVIVL